MTLPVMNSAMSIMNQGAAIPWYLSGGVASSDVVAVWQAIGARSFSQSKLSLLTTAEKYLTNGEIAPAWNTSTGWAFNNVANSDMYLKTSLTVTEGYSFVVKFADAGAAKFMCGAYTAPRGFAAVPRSGAGGGDGIQWWSGSYSTVLPSLAAGTIGIAGAQPYRNGVADGDPLAAWGGTITSDFNIGRMGMFSAAFIGKILGLALYSKTLSAPEFAAITTALDATTTYTSPGERLAVFGDSIAAGLQATDAAHRWANIVATTKDWTLINAGVNSTVLQNTVQNTVATIGAACDNNGRDTYATRLTPNTPTKVVILYGLNDLRLNDVAFSDSNFSTDLGEIVDGLVTSGVLAADIIICSPTYIPAASYTANAPWDGGTALKHAAYVTACSTVAAAKGCGYVDVYQAMADGGGDALMHADGIHPNDAGHAVIAAAVLAVL